MVDSSTATPSGQKIYKPLKDQLEQLNQAIHMVCSGTTQAADKEFRVVRKHVEELCDAQQKTLEDRQPLYMIFKKEAEDCDKRLQQLQQETLGHAVNRKTKAEMKALKENMENVANG